MHTHAVTHYPDCAGGNCDCKIRSYKRTLLIGVGILVFQIVAGIASNSLALLADSGHVAADNVSLVCAYALTLYIRRSEHRVLERYGFYVQLVLLVAVAFWFLYEGVVRAQKPEHVLGLYAAAAALLGGFANYWQHLELLGKGRDSHHKAVHAHVKSDMLQSGAVVLSGVAIAVFGWHLIDALCTVLIAIWMLFQAVELLRHGDHDHHHH